MTWASRRKRGDKSSGVALRCAVPSLLPHHSRTAMTPTTEPPRCDWAAQRSADARLPRHRMGRAAARRSRAVRVPRASKARRPACRGAPCWTSASNYRKAFHDFDIARVRGDDRSRAGTAAARPRHHPQSPEGHRPRATTPSPRLTYRRVRQSGRAICGPSSTASRCVTAGATRPKCRPAPRVRSHEQGAEEARLPLRRHAPSATR